MEPRPFWSPMCAPFKSETRTTFCHCADGSAATADLRAWSRGRLLLLPTTSSVPNLVTSKIPLASSLRTVHAELYATSYLTAQLRHVFDSRIGVTRFGA